MSTCSSNYCLDFSQKLLKGGEELTITHDDLKRCSAQLSENGLIPDKLYYKTSLSNGAICQPCWTMNSTTISDGDIHKCINAYENTGGVTNNIQFYTRKDCTN